MQIALANSSTYYFTTTFFKNRNDPEADETDFSKGEAWHPYEPQIALYNVVDFGYDISKNVIKPPNPSEIVVMLWPRQYGKTDGCATCAAALALRHSNSKIGIVSASEDASRDFINRIFDFVRLSPFKSMIKAQKVDRIKFTNGSEIISMPNSEKTIRGKSLRWLFIDEAALIDEAVLDGAAIPTTRTAGAFMKWKTPSVIILSTPQGENNRFFDYYMKGLENRQIGCRKCKHLYLMNDELFKGLIFAPLNLPNDMPNCQFCGNNDYEYVSKSITTIVLDPYKHPTRTPEQIQQELEDRGNTPLARQELLAEIISESAGVFPSLWVELAWDFALHNTISPRRDVTYVVSADFGKTCDATVFCAGYMDKGSVVLENIYHLPARGGLEYKDIRKSLLNYIVTYNPHLLMLDANSIGGPIVEQISYDLDSIRLYGIHEEYVENGTKLVFHINPQPNLVARIYSNKTGQAKGQNRHLGFISDYQSKKEAIENLVNLFQMSKIRIPPAANHHHAAVLYKELINYNYEYSSGKQINRIIYGTQRSHDDTVMALAYLCIGLRERRWGGMQAKIGGQDNFVLQQSEYGNLSW